MDDVTISQAEVDKLMRDIDGPVGDLMRQLARDIASIAREKVRIRIPGSHRTGRTSSARVPGYTKANITSTVGHSKLHGGLLFGGAEAPLPGLWLETYDYSVGRSETFPFLTTGLWSVTVE